MSDGTFLYHHKEIEFLRTFPKLEHLGFKEHPTSVFLPGQPAAEFWKEHDAKKPKP